MPLKQMRGPLRAAVLAMPAGIVLLVSGAVAVALGQRALGGTLIALAVIVAVAGWIVLLRIKNETTTIVRAAQEQRKADLERTFRRGPDGPSAP